MRWNEVFEEEEEIEAPSLTMFYKFTNPDTYFLSTWFREGRFFDPDLGMMFTTAEQYLLYNKAKLFGDEAKMKIVLESENLYEQRRLCGDVKNFRVNIWNGYAKQIAFRGNLLKFYCNRDIRAKLLATRGSLLVFASPDRVWGIGRVQDDPRAHNQQEWNGWNWLGEVLTKLRDAFDQNLITEKEFRQRNASDELWTTISEMDNDYGY